MGVSSRTVRRCFHDVVEALVPQRGGVLDCHQSKYRGLSWGEESAAGFSHFTGDCSVQAAIDGHRVPCKAPTALELRRQFYTGPKGPAVVMAYLVDAAFVAREFTGGAPGGTADTHVLTNMHLWDAMETSEYNRADPYIGLNRVVLGDAGYRSLDWLIVPFPATGDSDGVLTVTECRVFNFIHSAARQKVEQFNGRVTVKFAALRDRGQTREPEIQPPLRCWRPR